MIPDNLDLSIPNLGPCSIPSPLPARHFVSDFDRVMLDTSFGEIAACLEEGLPIPAFEAAGPRAKLRFQPGHVTAGIVTCGGLCPGINDVIRAITFSLWFNYGVRNILGFRYGYEGLVTSSGHEPMRLDPEMVDDINQHGGTILGSSRGPQDVGLMVDRLVALGVDLLFLIGGDGTLRGALDLVAEIARRHLPIALVGVPKTIDNDILLVDRTFGFETAVAMARDPIRAAHVEAKGVPYGIGLVKLMGRESGFVAAYAALSNSEVDVVLVPEVPFRMDGPTGLLAFLEHRLRNRRHAVVVVAEGAGQDLAAGYGEGGRDASGNRRLLDVGRFLCDAFCKHFGDCELPVSLKYIDPSYTIRSVPATPDDSVFCLRLAHNAVHAAMAGKTGMLIGRWNGQFVHVPMAEAVERRQMIDPEGPLWSQVTQAVGQPLRFV